MAILVAAMALLIFGLAAFVVDYGLAYSTKRTLQSGADAAALAAVRTVQGSDTRGQSCSTILSGPATASSSAAANSFLDLNKAKADAASSQTYQAACENGLFVAAVGTGRRNATAMAGIFGTSEIEIGGKARAVLGPAGSAIGLRPFGICKDIADQIVSQPTVNHLVPIDNGDLGCGYASGNWAMMDMNGGGNATSEAKGWIQNGYDKPVKISSSGGVVINGDTGTPSPGGFEGPMNSILDQVSLLPVFSSIQTPNGNNANFVITGFVGVKFCGWKFNGQSGNGACFDPSGPFPKSYLQLRYSSYVAVGELSSWCRLGDTCDRGVRVIKLIE